MITPLREPTPPERILPTNGAAEQRLLGATMCDNHLLDEIAFLQPDHFANALHGRIFTTIRQLVERGDVANIVSMARSFEEDPALLEYGGRRYLAQVVAAGAMCGAGEVKTYAQAVFDCHLRRELIRLTEEATAAAYAENLDDPPMGQLERLEAVLQRLAETGQSGAGARSLSTMMAAVMANAQEAYARGDQISGARTGFADLDAMLGGLQPADLVILAGRPSMGKTSFGENIARNAAKAGSAVVFYSLEMSWEQLTARTMAGDAKIAADWARRPAEFNRYVDDLVVAQGDLNPLLFHIDDEASLPVAAMHARARRLKRQHGLGLVVVDYLQLASAARPQGRAEMNRVQEVAEITAALKRMAKDLDVPVLALSQLSRKVEEREDKRPQLSDLRESGAIEQDADVVMFLFREEYYLREPNPADHAKWTAWRDKLNAVHDKAELIVAKNRHGPTATVQLRFDKGTTQFSNLARGFD
jgi:replicative DNA helicase